MPATTGRPLWSGIPANARTTIEALVGGHVIHAQNCPGGFSPGLASRLTLSDGRRVFVKAMDADAWPDEAATHRAEARVAATLPQTAPAPAFLGSFDDGQWIVLAFEDFDGEEPTRPWDLTTLGRVVEAIAQLATSSTPSPSTLPTAHPRLGGWADLVGNEQRLGHHSPWAANHLSCLVSIEEDGLVAAQGTSLVHFDLYPHNMLLAADRVVFVDWPHARRGAPIIDLVMFLTSVAADGIDPESLLAHAVPTHVDPSTVDAILVANAGFLLSGALRPSPPGLEAIAAAKLHLGLGGVGWLQQRLGLQPRRRSA